ncbi:unnamed protein product [Medioppia subpectinata]|uniref:Uncharacterized protein n=1 Tax=Medioppia subpectinata TaxID=1979941 RepID=A0A7R9LKZ5_9ACAR|nr:unnamed protein product [Medioppia subpectinata]CAG2119738.1 unnamed protein product [Medioppia subpectinata]
MAIIMSSNGNEISAQSSPLIVDYNGFALNAPMFSYVSANLNANTFSNKGVKQSVNSSALKSTYVSTNSEKNDENIMNKPSLPFSITSILNRDDNPFTKHSKPDIHPSIANT